VIAQSGVVHLFVRMIVSLAIVLAIVGVAAFVMRRRGTVRGNRRPVGFGRRQPRRRAGRPTIEVLGRVALTRSSSAVALRFADRVVLIGASDQAPAAVLADIAAGTWDSLLDDPEWAVPESAPDRLPGERPTFLQALREATVRSA
jgi:flagellar biogenesis protein FliO